MGRVSLANWVIGAAAGLGQPKILRLAFCRAWLNQLCLRDAARLPTPYIACGQKTLWHNPPTHPKPALLVLRFLPIAAQLLFASHKGTL
jgi:hypothetical protein